MEKAQWMWEKKEIGKRFLYSRKVEEFSFTLWFFEMVISSYSLTFTRFRDNLYIYIYISNGRQLFCFQLYRKGVCDFQWSATSLLKWGSLSLCRNVCILLNKHIRIYISIYRYIKVFIIIYIRICLCNVISVY